MMIPEILPRISPAQIAAEPSIGGGVQLRQKYRFLIVMGVFGKGASIRSISRQMYETSIVSELCKSADGGPPLQLESVDDETAHNRLDNTLRDKLDKSLIQAELDYLRSCYEHVFGAVALSQITDDLLRCSSVNQLLQALLGSSVQVDWLDVDPIMALEALSFANQNHWSINIERDDGLRWTPQTGSVKPRFEHDLVAC